MMTSFKRCTFLLSIGMAWLSHGFDLEETAHYLPSRHDVHAEWTVVGAGTAGILTVGMLIDAGIAPSSIIWVDPDFEGGRMGKYYGDIPANSPARAFHTFINTCKLFQECDTPAMRRVMEADPNKIYRLEIIIQPLKDMTELLRSKVFSLQDTLVSLDFVDNKWVATTRNSTFTTNHVILAIGSYPITLSYLPDQTIPIDTAFNRAALAREVGPHSTVGVVGDAHSAILIMKNLYELPVGRIINFYKKPLLYITDVGGENIGLQGVAAQWAKEKLERNPAPNIIRVKSSPEALKAWTPLCDKIIYAMGYKRNPLPIINGHSDITYNDVTGEILPRIFGFGIAFPQLYISATGNVEHRVGMRQFVEYARKVLPEWLKQKNADDCLDYDQLEELFVITPIKASSCRHESILTTVY
jgi:hypothetical protein